MCAAPKKNTKPKNQKASCQIAPVSKYPSIQSVSALEFLLPSVKCKCFTKTQLRKFTEFENVST